MRSNLVLSALLVAPFVFGTAANPVSFTQVTDDAPRPLVIYHGMGDAGCSDGMTKIKQFFESEIPGIYVHNVFIGKSCSDQSYSFLDSVNRQVEEVCQKLKADANLAGGFNAIGFSQGGQFLRAYVERCNDPPVHNLITFGSQHQGVETLPGCTGYSSLECEAATKLLSFGAYSSLVQSRVVQAQYFKDPFDIKKYLKANIFLPDINNEGEVKNPIYKERLQSLNLFVMYLFSEDTNVIPKESSWFGFFDGKQLRQLRELPIYTEDWIGLKQLDAENRLQFRTALGAHMQISLQQLRDEVVPLLLD